jgi:hypothetical protein
VKPSLLTRGNAHEAIINDEDDRERFLIGISGPDRFGSEGLLQCLLILQ